MNNQDPSPNRAREPLDTEAIIDALSAGTILEALRTGLNAISLMLLTADGRYVYANQMAVNGIAETSTESIKGKSLFDIAPKRWVEERIEYFNRAVQEDRPLIIIEVIEGVRLSSRISPLNSGSTGDTGNHVPLVLVTVEPIIATRLQWIQENASTDNVIFARHIDLGRLNILSDREIEVLALMGQGYRTREIAEKLSRSISTINRHRESIGEKIGVTDRAKLIRLANIAVLQPEDAQRIRMELNPERRHHKGPEGFNTYIDNRPG